MAWVYLVIAGVFEWGWPVGLKLGWTDEGANYPWIIFAVICMGFSGALLLMAQRTIPIGTAYAVWTGLGAVGTFLIGVMFFWRFRDAGTVFLYRPDHSGNSRAQAVIGALI